MFRFRLMLFLGIVVAFSSPVAAEHPTHISRGEIEFNADTQCLEFAVCLYEEDVRTVVRRQSDAIVDLDDHDKTDPALEAYLRDNFYIADLSKKERELTWYGYEVDKEGVWIYFEVTVTEEPTNLVVGNRMLLEVQPGNVSDFRFRWGKKRATLLFNAQTNAHRLEWKEAQPVAADQRVLSLSVSETLRPSNAPSFVQPPAFDAPPVPRRVQK